MEGKIRKLFNWCVQVFSDRRICCLTDKRLGRSTLADLCIKRIDFSSITCIWIVIGKSKEGGLNMGSLIILGMVGIPCALFLLWCLTPWGRKWLKENRMIWNKVEPKNILISSRDAKFCVSTPSSVENSLKSSDIFLKTSVIFVRISVIFVPNSG